jgi:alkylation response protein AidB-like acyl-CoA dehydrogenase
MDFTRTEAAQDLSGLVGTIVDAVCTPEHQRGLDRLDQRFDTTLWHKLIDADVLSSAAPGSVGGGGFGTLEQAAILTALGRQLASVPYLESVILGAGALVRFGSSELQRQWAAPAVGGETVLTVAIDGELGEAPVQATTVGDDFRLTGSRTQVSYGPVADAYLVAAETDSGTKVFLISAADDGVSMTPLQTTGRNSAGRLDLAGVHVSAARVVGDAEMLAWLGIHRAVGLAAYQLGVLQRALELTAEYARTREQFDRPIGSFQAVAQRLADGYIDLQGLRLTLQQASWRLSEELPCDVEAATAAFWAADAGHRIAHTAVHVHGGVGIDMDHPIHRYFITAKETEFALGGATAHLRVIGRDLADAPA